MDNENIEKVDVTDNARSLHDNIFIERDEKNIAWLYFDQLDSSTNVLSEKVFHDLDLALRELEMEPPTGLVFLSNKKSGFIAGADVSEFVDISTEEQVKTLIGRGQTMFNRIESLPFTTVALIHGFCLGGGMELSLACNYRIACQDEKTRLGLPEVLLGIHPGFGGSVRLTYMLGVFQAMPLMLTGRAIDTRKAKKLGIVDQVVPRRQIRAAAASFACKNVPKRKQSWLVKFSNISLLRPIIANQMRKKLSKKVNQDHYPAPYALVKLWEEYGADKTLMMNAEADSIAQLFMHPTAKHLVRIFHLQEQLKKAGSVNADLDATNTYQPKHVHVIGAGAMGGDIAAWCALKGMKVTLQDREAKFIEPALGRAHKLFTRRLKDPYLRQDAFDRLIPDHHGYGIEKADIVIEAIIEDLDIKANLYKSIEPRLKEGAILATNTSSIPLDDLSVHLKNPQLLIGLHFFNPVPKMQLVEVISSANTSAIQIAKGMRFTRLIDRLPLPTVSSPGFLVNRVLLPYLLEAVELLNDGVPAEVIDKVAMDFGMPVGPIALADTVGLDICLSVSNILAKSLHIEVPALLANKVEAGNLGVKSGQGFYQYAKGKVVKQPPANNSHVGIQVIEDRLILRLLNECIAVSREGVIENDDLLDAGMVFGTGFAPFRGGPMCYLYTKGVEESHLSLLALHEKYGERFTPDQGWVELLDSSKNEAKEVVSEHDDKSDENENNEPENEELEESEK